MMSQPLVSIIVPSYNYAHYLPETLDAVRLQHHEHFELLLIDDGSTDGTRELVATYLSKDKRIKYIYQHNQGLSAARNTGLQYAQGDFIQFLDADDLISAEKIKLQLAHFETNPDVGLSYTDAFYFVHNQPEKRYRSIGLSNESWIPQFQNLDVNTWRRLLTGNIMPVNSALIRREAIIQTGFFDTNLSSLEDWDYWFRCSLNYRFAYCAAPEAFALVRVHHTSMSQNLSKMYENELQLRIKFTHYLTQLPLDASQRQSLQKWNRKCLKRPAAYLILNKGFFSIAVARKIIEAFGGFSYISAFFKALNDWRKGQKQMSS